MGEDSPISDGPVFVSAAEVARCIDLRGAISALRRTYEATAPNSKAAGRVVARGVSGARIRALAAVPPSGDLLGAKLHVQPIAGGSTYLIALFSQADGALVGLLDGQAITEIRTGAVSALALDSLAPEGPLRLAVLGSGTEARSHVRAVAALRAIEEVLVFSPNRTRREQFAEDMQAELSVSVTASESASAAVGACSALIAAARSHGEVPIFDPAALNDGTVIISIGSTLPEQRELDERVLERAALIVSDEPAELLEQSGDCIAARNAGFELSHKTFSLAELLQGLIAEPLDRTAINIFKSVGSALQDVTVASEILRLANASGHPTGLAVNLSSKEKHG